ALAIDPWRPTRASSVVETRDKSWRASKARRPKAVHAPIDMSVDAFADCACGRMSPRNHRELDQSFRWLVPQASRLARPAAAMAPQVSVSDPDRSDCRDCDSPCLLSPPPTPVEDVFIRAGNECSARKLFVSEVMPLLRRRASQPTSGERCRSL